MKKLISAIVGVAAVALMFAAPAQSATVTWTNPDPNTLVDTGVPHYSSAVGTVQEGLTGSLEYFYRSPWEGSSQYATGTFTSVAGDSYASYVFDKAISAVRFMWGSVDDYNGLEFWNNGVLIDTLDGSDSQLDSAQKSTGFILATVLTTNVFDEIRFLSDKNAFEFTNLSAVPLPAALPLYGAGLAAMGFIGWRKRRKAAATA